MQVQGREGFPVKYNSVFHCAYQVVKEEGIASFWHGSMCSFMNVRSAEADPLLEGKGRVMQHDFM